MARLNLMACDFEAMKPRIRQYAKAGAWKSMFHCLDSNSYLAFFYDNRKWFEERGLYEAALLFAWNNQKVTVQWRGNMRVFLMLADRERLMQASDPLPAGDEFTIYRGVTNSDYKLDDGTPIAGDQYGISWTLDIDVARRFAIGLGSGRVYSMVVKRSDIYAYLGQSEGETDYRREQEVLVMVNRFNKTTKIKLVERISHKKANEHRARIIKEDAVRLQAELAAMKQEAATHA